MRALILEGAASRGCLAAARSLAAAGWDVGIGHPPGHSLAAVSRSVRFRHELPDLGAGLPPYLDAVQHEVRRLGYDLVMGAGDAEVLALAHGRDQLDALVPHPPPAVLTATMDKLALSDAAAAEGILSPATEAVGPHTDVTSWLARGPVVVKPRLHWRPGSQGAPLRVEAELVRGEAELRRRADAVSAAGGEPVVQEFVTGRLTAYVALLGQDGALVGHCQQHALHTFPEPVGVSARAETRPVDPGLADGALRLLRRLGVTGLAELQFLVDGHGRSSLIDVNARFYGSLQLAVSAGADLPRLWADSVTGRRPSDAPVVVARAGVRYQWLEGDLRRSMAGRSLRGVLDCVRYSAGASHSIWSARDRRPGAAHLRALSARAARRLRGAA